MAHSSLLGIDRIGPAAPGHDTASLGPSDEIRSPEGAVARQSISSLTKRATARVVRLLFHAEPGSLVNTRSPPGWLSWV